MNVGNGNQTKGPDRKRAHGLLLFFKYSIIYLDGKFYLNAKYINS
jgi:hypothetical protein